MKTNVAQTSLKPRKPFKGRDLTGFRFSRLTVLHRDEATGRWICACECGKQKAVQSTHLVQGATRSCGCLQREWTVKYNTKHGKTGSDLFELWKNLFARCYTTTNPAYQNYGGRGITVCDHWRDFSNFQADMGERPQGYSLDRMDNNGPYSPENCRWATRTEQARNTRANRLITFKGKDKCVADWAFELGINSATIRSRLDRYGWSVEKALTTPVRIR